MPQRDLPNQVSWRNSPIIRQLGEYTILSPDRFYVVVHCLEDNIQQLKMRNKDLLNQVSCGKCQRRVEESAKHGMAPRLLNETAKTVLSA
jgi:hypothetical protein